MLMSTIENAHVTARTRGSAKLLDAWRTRTLSEESLKEIAGALDASPATVERAHVTGGEQPTGVQLSLRYEGDDVPWCGNDLQFWLQWLRKHGGKPRPPRVIIDGTPFPDLIHVDLEFGSPVAELPQAGLGPIGIDAQLGELAAGGIRG
jgi:hypothetical protein